MLTGWLGIILKLTLHKVAARGALRKPFTQSNCAMLNCTSYRENIHFMGCKYNIISTFISHVVEDLLEFKNISDKCQTAHKTLEKQKYSNHFMANLIYMYQAVVIVVTALLGSVSIQ
jgi:hypothetical protein